MEVKGNDTINEVDEDASVYQSRLKTNKTDLQNSHLNKEAKSKNKTTSEINNFNKNEPAKQEKNLQKAHQLIQSINLDQEHPIHQSVDAPIDRKKKKPKKPAEIPSRREKNKSAIFDHIF